ncbi:universal stress protein [Hyphomicrobium sp. CS1BSMeth3]|uniref:universal stress protein n=1 Tax=Hyphomicrobium sp. CS1BSMeth3 TaxID=1892844 RepID=UPI000930C5AA|nr:universal stress protein [Hyphomicrobium sp. CS1BSMeth3]
MYDRILIATDGSELAEKAVDQGLAMAKAVGAKVIVVRVTSMPAPMVYEGVVVALPTEEIRAEIAARVAEHFTVLKSKATALGVDMETVHVEHDQPWQAIIDTAKQKAANLIVMASHGRRGISAVLLGSETQKVLTHTTIPVLVCR